MRLAAMRRSRRSPAAVDRALPPTSAAAPAGRRSSRPCVSFDRRGRCDRDPTAAAARAALEGGAPQRVGPTSRSAVAGSPTTRAPADALVADPRRRRRLGRRRDVDRGRAAPAKVQGRRTTARRTWPVDVPPGDWARTLQTTWVEPAYLEPDASWCAPGGEPVDAAGQRRRVRRQGRSEVGAVARRLADEHGRPVRVLYTREDVVRLGPKRPPIGAGVARRWSGVVRVARTPGIADAIAARGAGARRSRRSTWPDRRRRRAPGRRLGRGGGAAGPLGRGPDTVMSPDGAAADGGDRRRRRARHGARAARRSTRSCCAPTASAPRTWRSAGCVARRIAVDDEGAGARPHDPLVRHPAGADIPPIDVEIERRATGQPVNGSDAVFAAVAAAAWRAAGHPPRWPLAPAP